MALKRGSGEPFIAIIHDNSQAATITINRFLSNLLPKKGRVEVHKLASGLVEKLKTAQLVIQLRTCPIKTTTEGLHFVTGDKFSDLANRKFVQVLRPQFIVRRKIEHNEHSLEAELLRLKVPVIGVSLSALDCLDEKHIDFVVTGFRQVLGNFFMINQGSTLRTLAVFFKHQYTVPEQGVFKPKVDLFAEVTAGQLVGILDTGKMQVALKAKQAGKIIELCKEKPVKKKDLVFSVGEPTAF